MNLIRYASSHIANSLPPPTPTKFFFSLSSFNPTWLVSLLFQVLLWLYLPVLEIEVWSGCHAGHVVESCMVYRMDHEIPGRIAPDGTSFLHPGSDLDYTKYPGLSLDCVFDFSILWWQFSAHLLEYLWIYVNIQWHVYGDNFISISDFDVRRVLITK